MWYRICHVTNLHLGSMQGLERLTYKAKTCALDQGHAAVVDRNFLTDFLAMK